MDNQKTMMMAAAVLIALYYYRNDLMSMLPPDMVTQRNIVIAAMVAVAGYYLLKVKGCGGVMAANEDTFDDEDDYEEEAFDCGANYEHFAEEKADDAPVVEGNFLDGTAKHANLFEQQVQPNLPYVLGTTLPPPKPEIIKRGFMSADLRPRPMVEIDPNETIPFGMSSVAVNVTQAGDAGGLLVNRDIGVGKCM